MCGIIGMASLSGAKNWIDKSDWLQKAILVDTLRGEHSTGVYTVDTLFPNEAPFVYKKPLAGYDFLQLEKTKEIIDDVDKYTFIVGHNRKATQGAKTAANAHPFQCEHITLVHNGTLLSRNGVPGSKLFEVDSEAICYAIAKNGAADTLPKLDGAYALVWYDAETCTLNLARNTERPLHFAFSEDGDNMFFASEAWMIRELVDAIFKVKTIYKLKPGLHMQVDAFSTSLKDYGVSNFEILQASHSWYYDYSYGNTSHKAHIPKKEAISEGKKIAEMAKRLDSIGYTYGERVVFKPKMVKVHDKKPEKCNLYGTVTREDAMVQDETVAWGVLSLLIREDTLDKQLFIGTAKDMYTNGNGKITLVLENVQEYLPLPEPEDVNLGEDERLVTGPDSKEIPVKKFLELVKHGCGFCTTDIFVEDADDIEWTMDNQPICYDCVEKMNT